MNWKFLAKTALMISAFLGIEKIPIDAQTNQVAFTDDQNAKLKAELGEDYLDKIKAGFNQEIKALAENNLDMISIKHELDALVLEANLSAEELANLPKDKSGNPTLDAQIKAISEKQKELNTTLEKLVSEGIGNQPLTVIKGGMNNMNTQHSATHLFGSTKAYDAFEKRNWNARLAGQSIKATDFNTNGTIPLLQSDLEHFVEENTGLLTSMFNDFAELPAQWSRRTGVLDRVSDGYIIPAEIVQGRKKGWSPKNDFKIASEEGRVYRKKIDVTFDGYELQKIENTWIRTYNKADGSHPWKTSFIGFLLAELIKQQQLDDRRAQINGIYVESPEGDGNPGAAVNSQNGLRFLWHFHKNVKQNYRPFDMGTPTDANIVDYINEMIERIPEVDRNESGMEIQLSSRWLQAYLKKAGELYPKLFSTDQGVMKYQLNSPIDYPNFIFQELKDQTKTDFIGITKSANIQILDYDTSEKGRFTVTNEKRDTHIFADYRLGIRIMFVGTKLEAGDKREFELQKVWSNNVPVFGDETVIPAFDDTTGILKITYPKVKVDEAWKTNITSITGATKGSVVKIVGNTGLIATKNVVQNSNLLLASNFDLQSGGTLTLFVQEDGKLKELSRTTEPEVAATTDIDFEDDVLDVIGGNVFRFVGVADTTITSIVNGVEGKVITIYGTDAAGIELTINTIGNIVTASSCVMAAAIDYIKLVYVDGKWRETDRLIN